MPLLHITFDTNQPSNLCPAQTLHKTNLCKYQRTSCGKILTFRIRRRQDNINTSTIKNKVLEWLYISYSVITYKLTGFGYCDTSGFGYGRGTQLLHVYWLKSYLLTSHSALCCEFNTHLYIVMQLMGISTN